MNRATFLRRAALLAAGVVAADQIDLLERLTWQPKRLWTGADFGQTHTLDDYEEGYWTPTVGPGATYTGLRGRYVKIGNLVYVTMQPARIVELLP